MATGACLTVAVHQDPQGLDVQAEDFRDDRESGGGRRTVVAAPVPDGGLEDPNLRGELGLGLWSRAKQFTKRHAPYLAKHYVASIVIRLGSGCLDFADIFRAELKRRKHTHVSFAEKVGVTPAFVSLIATRRAKMPMDRADQWADALGLTGNERRGFIIYAGLAHIPDQKVQVAIADELDDLRQRVADLTERARRLK